jgi:hypothetical protein
MLDLHKLPAGMEQCCWWQCRPNLQAPWHLCDQHRVCLPEITFGGSTTSSDAACWDAGAAGRQMDWASQKTNFVAVTCGRRRQNELMGNGNEWLPPKLIHSSLMRNNILRPGHTHLIFLCWSVRCSIKKSDKTVVYCVTKQSENLKSLLLNTINYYQI